ncbi:MAG: tryptophan synthase subunit alpha [Promethearchaeota archaeon]
MKRIDATFESLKLREDKAFIPFLVLGDPDPGTFISIARAIEPSADVLEFGIPYTDPVADGPVIQEANSRAFSSGMSFSKACELIRQVRDFTSKPIVILTYANVIGVNERMPRTLQRLKDAGVDALILADVPLEEGREYFDAIREFDMDMIFLVAPTTTKGRLASIIEMAHGFLYVVAVKGVTGARDAVVQDTADLIEKIKNVMVNTHYVPVCVGFGISKPSHVDEIVKLGVDGVIVGSAIIKIIAAHTGNPAEIAGKVREYVKSMKARTRTGKLFEGGA